VARVAAPDAPVPFAQPLEGAYVPTTSRIADTIRATVAA
jgi:pyruvate/2-oxoglutarate/acetoin dehydrogenase E1 component